MQNCVVSFGIQYILRVRYFRRDDVFTRNMVLKIQLQSHYKKPVNHDHIIMPPQSGGI